MMTVLPPQIIQKIAKYLDYPDLIKLRSASITMHNIIDISFVYAEIDRNVNKKSHKKLLTILAYLDQDISPLVHKMFCDIP